MSTQGSQPPGSSKKRDESEELRELLLDLQRANERETESRAEAEVLLDGLYALTHFRDENEMFQNLLEILKKQIGFENALILIQRDGAFKSVACTSERFHEFSWPSGETESLTGSLRKVSAYFDVAQVPLWQRQPVSVREGVSSALHVMLRENPSAILICTHTKRGHFAEKHLKLATRFIPLASQALMNFDNRVALEKINQQIVLEIKEKEKAQALIINSSKMAALGEMAGGIAHEINTPLAAMILRAELMEMENEELKSPSPNIAAGLKSIVETGHRIAKIITGLKSFSRDARNDSSEIFLSADLVERTVALCGEHFKSYGVELRIQDDSGGAQIYGQVVQLSQVLLNLLNNSFDAVRNSKEKWIELSIKRVGDQLEIGVTDSGTGIPPAVVEKMFQPFFTTKEVGQGTGLGLSISANIVKNHSGQLIYDADHTNTCFLVRLPIVLEGIREKKNG